MAEATGGTLKKSDLEEIIQQVFERADGAGVTKEEMREALDEIADLCDPDTDVERADDGTWSVIEGHDSDADDEAEADEEA